MDCWCKDVLFFDISPGATVERGGDNLKGFENLRTEDGSSQGQNLGLTSLTALLVPFSLDSGQELDPELASSGDPKFLVKVDRKVLSDSGQELDPTSCQC